MPKITSNSIAILLQNLNILNEKAAILSCNNSRSQDTNYVKREALETTKDGFSSIRTKESIDNSLVKNIDKQQSLVCSKIKTGEYFSKIQSFFNDNFSNKGANASSSLESLSNNSLHNPLHDLLSFIKSVNNFGNNIDFLKDEAKLDLYNSIIEANKLIEKISNYNNQNPKTIELVSQRRNAIHDLSSLIGIDVVNETNGTVSIYLSETKEPLVIGSSNAFIGYNESNQTLSLNGFNHSEFSTELGEIGSLFVLNCNKIPSLKAQIDEYAFNVKNNLNKIHNLGSPTTPPNNIVGSIFGLTNETIVSGNGSLTIASLNTNGTIANSINIVLHQNTNVGNIINQINRANTGIEASLNNNGQLALSGNSIAISGGKLCSGDTFNADSCNSFSGFFGLNDLFISSDNSLNPNPAFTSNSLSIRSDIKSNPNLISKGVLTIDGVGSADGSNAFKMSDFYSNTRIAFSENLNLTLNEFSAFLISNQSIKCKENSDILKEERHLYNELSSQASKISGVDVENTIKELEVLLYQQYITNKILEKIIEMKHAIFNI